MGTIQEMNVEKKKKKQKKPTTTSNRNVSIKKLTFLYIPEQLS